MAMRRTVWAALLLAVPAGVPATSPADAGDPGCTAPRKHEDTTNTTTFAWCYYTATGPGSFVAATENSWVISAWRNDKWEVVAREAVPGHPRTGSLDTAAGELISVALGCGLPDGLAACSDTAGRPTGFVTAYSIEGVPDFPVEQKIQGCTVVGDYTDLDPGSFEATNDYDWYDVRKNNCEYIATTAMNVYVAATPSDTWSIAIWRNGLIYRDRIIYSNPQHRAPPVGTFEWDFQPGDIVRAGISGSSSCSMHVCTGTRHGFLHVQSSG